MLSVPLPLSGTLWLTISAMRIAHDSQTPFLEGPVGRLEAILWTPARSDAPPLAALVCHPHPLFGGTMHNKVVYNAAKTMDVLGIPTLRFNFRGAGLSEGEHDKGQGEQGDVQAALDFLAAQFPGIPLLLAGFSFGSAVGLRVGCGDSRVVELIAMGMPVTSMDCSYLRDCRKPKLFVHGGEDQFSGREKLEEVVSTLPGEKRLVVVESADHFFAGHIDEFNAAIAAWLQQRHPELHPL